MTVEKKNVCFVFIFARSLFRFQLWAANFPPQQVESLLSMTFQEGFRSVQSYSLEFSKSFCKHKTAWSKDSIFGLMGIVTAKESHVQHMQQSKLMNNIIALLCLTIYLMAADEKFVTFQTLTIRNECSWNGWNVIKRETNDDSWILLQFSTKKRFNSFIFVMIFLFSILLSSKQKTVCGNQSRRRD